MKSKILEFRKTKLTAENRYAVACRQAGIPLPARESDFAIDSAHYRAPDGTLTAITTERIDRRCSADGAITATDITQVFRQRGLAFLELMARGADEMPITALCEQGMMYFDALDFRYLKVGEVSIMDACRAGGDIVITYKQGFMPSAKSAWPSQHVRRLEGLSLAA